MDGFDGFPGGLHDAGGTTLFARIGGNPDGPPLLLLHGYPQTHAMWRRVALKLAPTFCIVLADLRGYGDSAKPAPAATPELDHAQYSKRAMAADTATASRGSRCSTSCRRSTSTSAPTCASRRSTTTGSS